MHQVPGPHHLQRMKAVEVYATDRPHIEVRFGVVDGLGKVHVDTTQRVHHAGETVEVQFDIMLNRYPEVLLNRRNELGRTLIQGGVDLVGALYVRALGTKRSRGIERMDTVLGVGIEVENHDDVAVDAVDSLAADPVADVLLLSAHRSVDPTSRMFSVPLSVPWVSPAASPLTVNAVHQVVQVPGVAPDAGRR